MPFHVITGAFYVVGTSPTGDSIHFRADAECKWNMLGANAPLILKGRTRTAQLRFEAIDAPETHFQPHDSVIRYYEPLHIANASRAKMLQEVGVGNVVVNSQGIVMLADNEGARGYILARHVDKHSRPVAFVYAGDPPVVNGSRFHLDVAHLKKSVNYRLIEAGLVYPTYYPGLFPDLRAALTEAVVEARQAGRGVWAHDKTNKGVDVYDLTAVMDRNVILPKLFRRIVDYMDGGGGIEGFDDYLAAKQEQVLMLPEGHFTHFDNIVNIEGITVSLSRPPEDLVFMPG
jgi:hypothetical protein